MNNKHKPLRRLITGLNRLSWRCELILLIGLPAIIVASLALLPEFIYISENYHDYALTVYPGYFEHIAMTFLITVCGALLLDIIEKSHL